MIELYLLLKPIENPFEQLDIYLGLLKSLISSVLIDKFNPFFIKKSKISFLVTGPLLNISKVTFVFFISSRLIK